jgi:hypothetical protein
MSSLNSNGIPPQQTPTSVKVLAIDPAKVALFRQKLLDEQNFLLAMLAGCVAAGLGAILWAIVTYASGYNTAVMALVVGALVGYSVRTFGKGVQDRFGLLGAALSLVGCVAGHGLAVAAFISRQESASLPIVFMAMLLHPFITLAAMTTGFGALDIVFYGIALYEGYKLSFRKVTPAEKESLYGIRPGSP